MKNLFENWRRFTNEALGPDSDYLDKLKYKQDYGVPNPEVAASNARIAAAKAKRN